MLGSSPGEGKGSPLQYSCLKNAMDKGAWMATVRGITKSRARLSNFTSESGSLALLSARSGQYISPHQAWPSTFTQHSPQISWLLKWNSVCAPAVSLRSSKCAKKHVISKLEFQAIWQNQYIPPVKAEELQPQSSQVSTLGHFSVHYDNSFSPLFEFSKRTCCLPLLIETASPVQFHQIRLTTGMAMNTHRTLPTELITLPTEVFIHGMVQSVLGLS